MGQAKERMLPDRCMIGFDRPERAALRLGWRYSRDDNGDEPREDDAELEARCRGRGCCVLAAAWPRTRCGWRKASTTKSVTLILIWIVRWGVGATLDVVAG